MSTRQFFVNASSRHAVFVQRFAGGEVRKMLKYVNELQAKTIALINSRELTPKGFARQASLFKDLNDLALALNDKMGKEMGKDMLEFAKYEAEFTKKMAEKGMKIDTFAVPSNQTIKTALETNVMKLTPSNVYQTGKRSESVGEALRHFWTAKGNQVEQVIRDGMGLGRTSSEIIGDLKHVTNRLARHNAEALIRTITNHVSTLARMETLKENADVLEGYEVVATLDDRTTLTCAGLDGKVFTLDEVEYPPYHWNCRSTLIPVVKQEFNLGAAVTGERPSIVGNEAELVGANTKFGGWLRGQSADFKKEYFSQFPNGKEKYSLFESGGLSIDKFTDATGAQYTLSELRALEPMAFDKAGL